MADQTIVHIGENSAEEIAFKLLLEIAHAESKETRLYSGKTKPDRAWILDTYSECLRTVRTPIHRAK